MIGIFNVYLIYATNCMTNMKIARIYLRVSTTEQNTLRQEKIIDEATASGYYIAKVYREQASGTIKERPKLR